MTPTAANEKTRRERTTMTETAPLRVEITNEEILADLLYPVGRDRDRASRRRQA